MSPSIHRRYRHVPPRSPSFLLPASRRTATIRWRQRARKQFVTRRGVAAEELAAAFLQEHGLRIIARNYRCRLGEIDLVALERGTTVFVEVRQRSSSAFGGAAASITARKQARLIRAARRSPSPMRTA